MQFANNFDDIPKDLGRRLEPMTSVSLMSDHEPP